MTVSEWADQYRMLSRESSAEAGKWKTNRAPYQRGIMDAWSDSRVKEMVIISSAQVGKTEIVNNIIGYHIHLDQATMLLLQPTLEMAESWSKDRFAPMLRDTKVLTGLVKDPRTRDSGNTMLHKLFKHGHISIVGANSPAGLSSKPIRFVFCDEVDRYPISAGTEGDPISLAKKRSITFHNKKLLLTSTPTTKGGSRIEAAYLQSDQRRYHVPCPHCGKYQTLKWDQVRWESTGEPDKMEHKPETAYYLCENNCIIKDSDKAKMLELGRWIAEKPFNGVAGFHINELYSPWVSFAEMAKEFLRAKLSPEMLKTWVNTSLGETWEEDGETIQGEDLFKRRENWGKVAPADVVLLTAGVDVQGDRLELEVKGWGRQEECWSIAYHIIYGNPAEQHVWELLDAYLSRPIQTAAGIPLQISSTCIDSGGHHTQAVYEFCATRSLRNIFAIKGVSKPGQPIMGRPSTSNRYGLRLYSVNTDTAKEMIYSRLKLTEPGAGYFHFPMDREIEYFRQLTAEKRVAKCSKGSSRHEWIKMRTRNEVLDCTVYALAAMKLFDNGLTNLDCLADEMEQLVKSGGSKQAAAEPTAQGVATGRYVKWPDERDQRRNGRGNDWIPRLDNWLQPGRESYHPPQTDNWFRRRPRTDFDNQNWNKTDDSWLNKFADKLNDIEQ